LSSLATRVCRWINEESCPLGMHQVISRPPSKPVHPRERRSRLTGPVEGRSDPVHGARAAVEPGVQACRYAVRMSQAMPDSTGSTGRSRPRVRRGYVLAVLTLIGSLLIVWHYAGLAGAREDAALRTRFVADSNE